MNRMKTAAFLCAACMAFTGVTAAYQAPAVLTVSAEDTAATLSGDCGAEGDNVKWTYDGNGTLTITGTGAMANFNYSTQPWRSVREKIKTAVVQEGVTGIGKYTFYGCEKMEQVTLPEGIEVIGSCAFDNCESLKAISIPATVTKIESDAFDDCGSLKTLLIPASVTKIESGALDNLENLVSIDVAEDNQNYCAKDGVLFTKDMKKLFCYPPQKADSAYVIPDGVNEIMSHAFNYCVNLTEITIPEGVETIGMYVFYHCSSLKELEIPDSVKRISVNTFDYCSSLTQFKVGSGNEKFSSADGVLFSKDQTKLIRCPEAKPDTAYTIPDSVTALDNYAFYYCGNLKEITIPESVTSFGNYAFAYSGLQSVKLPAGVEKLPGNLFSYCSALTAAVLPEGLTELGKYTFYYCSALEEVTIPENVTVIDNDVFYNCCALKEITIPENVTAINDYAFYNCSSLTEVTVPASVATIGRYAFSGCEKMDVIRILNPECAIDDSSSTIPARTAIYGCADSTAQAYAEKYNRTFATFEEAAAGGSGTCGSNGDNVQWEFDGSSATLTITGTGPMAYYSTEEYSTSQDTPWRRFKKDIQHVVIGDGVTTIGAGAFRQCANLTDISIPESVTEIGSAVFADCTGLKTVTIPAHVTELSEGAFGGNNGLQNI